MAQAEIKATLLIIQGPDQGARFAVGAEPLGLGRGAQNSVRIHDTEASRTHANLQCVNGTFLLTDQNSSNGTFVNGQPIRGRELASGDQIQIGRTVLVFSVDANDEESRLMVADRVNLVGHHDPQDRQSIVGEASQQEGQSVVRMAGRAGDAQQLAQTLANLQVLYRISEEVVRPTLSLEQLLSRILEMALEVAGADRGCVLLRRPEGGDLIPQVFRHRSGEDDPGRMPVSRSIVEYVLHNRQGVHTSDARSDERFTPGQSILQAGIREAICVPMQGRNELTGVIYLDIATPPGRLVPDTAPINRFSEDLLRLMVAVGRQSALAVEDYRYRQALVKAERLAAVGQTIAILSHHIKNILQGVRGGSYLIDLGLKDHNEELTRKGWKIVEKNQGRIYHLVMDMLTFSKERQPSVRRGQLNETVAEVCELMQSRANELQATLDCQLLPDMPLSTFDPEALHRAVLNIVTNALDAVEEVAEKQVTVQTGIDRTARVVFVSIRDTGPGIPPERLSQIFNIFESTKGARGTGIGLAVSQKIIREHGGDITVHSEPGRGAQFILEWPLIDDDASSVGSGQSAVGSE